MPASIFAGSKVKTLKSTLSLNGGADIISSTTNPQSSAVSAEPGSLLLNTTSGIMYRKLDAGSTTNWVEVGAGTGGKNYVKNPDFDGGQTTSWSMQKVTLSSLIPTGNIGAADAGHTISASSSSPLEGTYSLLVDGASAFTAGNCLVSAAFAIDREDMAKVLGWSFAYEAVTSNMDFSGTSAGTWAVYIAEVTTGTPDTVVSWIQPAGVYNLVQGSGVGLASGTFQTTAAGTAYRIVLVCINNEAAATTLKVDDFQLGPQKVLAGVPVTGMENTYTPTFGGGGLGTPTNVSFKWQRIADKIIVRGTLTTGTVTAAAGTISLPFGSIDETKTIGPNISGSTRGIVGRWFRSNGNASNAKWGSIAFTGSAQTTVALTNSDYTTALNPFSPPNISAILVNTDQLDIEFEYYANGLSSNTVMSQDTDTRVVAASGWNTAATTVLVSTTPTKITTFGQAVQDSHASWSSINQQYSVPVSGYYSVSFSVFGTVPSGVQLKAFIQKNSTIVSEGTQRNYSGSATDTNAKTNTIIFFNAGDVISFYAAVDAGTASVGSYNPTSYTIQRLSGPATIAASETVAGFWNTTAGQSIPNLGATVVFGNRYYDTHGAMNLSTGVYTVPVSGKYRITGLIEFSSSVSTSFRAIDLTGTSFFGIASKESVPAGVAIRVSGSVEFNYLAGQTISLFAYQNTGGALSLTSSASFNWLAISRIGN